LPSPPSSYGCSVASPSASMVPAPPREVQAHAVDHLGNGRARAGPCPELLCRNVLRRRAVLWSGGASRRRATRARRGPTGPAPVRPWNSWASQVGAGGSFIPCAPPAPSRFVASYTRRRRCSTVARPRHPGGRPREAASRGGRSLVPESLWLGTCTFALSMTPLLVRFSGRRMSIFQHDEYAMSSTARLVSACGNSANGRGAG
jgi:hypothetical protein